jgi:hypothetical protein
VRPIRTPGKAADENALLVPGGRVLNPQSYHSAFRISSTRHEEALGTMIPSMTLISLRTKNSFADLNRDLHGETLVELFSQYDRLFKRHL